MEETQRTVDVKTCRQCRECKQYVLGTMAAVGHSRKHGPALNKKTFDQLYDVIADPPPELLKELMEAKQKRKTWGKNKKPKNKPPKENDLQELLKAISPKLLKMVDAKIDADGQLVVNLEIAVPQDFFASAIMANLS